jgi:hypothetical protein
MNLWHAQGHALDAIKAFQCLVEPLREQGRKRHSLDFAATKIDLDCAYRFVQCGRRAADVAHIAGTEVGGELGQCLRAFPLELHRLVAQRDDQQPPLATASVLPNFDVAGNWDMRRHYDEQRRTFIGTYILYQCSTWTTAAIIDTLGFNVASVVRAAILLMLVLALLLNRRSFDWLAALVIFAGLSFRLSTQVAH